MAESNVYAEISALLDREEATIDSTVAGYDERLQEALAAARADHDDAVEPLTLRRAQLEVVRQTVKGLVEQAEEDIPPLDPQVPTAPAESADPQEESTGSTPPSTPPSSPDTSTPQEPAPDSSPSSEDQSTEEPEPTIPPAEPSTPTGDVSQQLEPTPSEAPITVTLAGAATAVTPDLAAHVEPETPVAMTKLSTGETVLVTAADVLAAADESIADADLPEAAKPIRNSDFL